MEWSPFPKQQVCDSPDEAERRDKEYGQDVTYTLRSRYETDKGIQGGSSQTGRTTLYPVEPDWKRLLSFYYSRPYSSLLASTVFLR